MMKTAVLLTIHSLQLTSQSNPILLLLLIKSHVEAHDDGAVSPPLVLSTQSAGRCFPLRSSTWLRLRDPPQSNALMESRASANACQPTPQWQSSAANRSLCH
ncbi:hypothetical protein QBC46DRAFT_99948 [Diplogelasinospora grovesii]|uniref:Uncharacterized protein n=1 Tax=Diplogelasinospora grovesii TaxID=303347 RepID=A0AAN6N987_9PEZI|nr:hypothetical protein QBC46DRAFT_99948 [Diplogelasinospora grovesii]